MSEFIDRARTKAEQGWAVLNGSPLIWIKRCRVAFLQGARWSTFEQPSHTEIRAAAEAILMVTQAKGVTPEYAWRVQFEEVQDELMKQGRAALLAAQKVRQG